jgi:hypothetical protein
VLPVRVRKVDPPAGLLSGVTWMDVVDLVDDNARSALLEGVRLGRTKPAIEPACQLFSSARIGLGRATCRGSVPVPTRLG